MSQLMQLVVRLNDPRRYPCSLIAVVGAALDNLTKGVIQRDAIRRALMETLHAAAEMKFLWPQYRSRIGGTTKIGSPGETTEKIPR